MLGALVLARPLGGCRVGAWARFQGEKSRISSGSGTFGAGILLPSQNKVWPLSQTGSIRARGVLPCGPFPISVPPPRFLFHDEARYGDPLGVAFLVVVSDSPDASHTDPFAGPRDDVSQLRVLTPWASAFT